MEREPGPCPALWASSQTYLLPRIWRGKRDAPPPGMELWDKLNLLFSVPSGQLCPAHHILGSSAPEVHSGAKNRLCLDTLGLRLETRTEVTKHCHSRKGGLSASLSRQLTPTQGGRQGRGFVPLSADGETDAQSRSHMKCKGMKL